MTESLVLSRQSLALRVVWMHLPLQTIVTSTSLGKRPMK